MAAAMSTNGQAACSVFSGIFLVGMWFVRTDFTSRALIVLFSVIMYAQITTGAWAESARENRKEADRQQKEALRQAFRWLTG